MGFGRNEAAAQNPSYMFVSSRLSGHSISLVRLKIERRNTKLGWLPRLGRQNDNYRTGLDWTGLGDASFDPDWIG